MCFGVFGCVESGLKKKVQSVQKVRKVCKKCAFCATCEMSAESAQIIMKYEKTILADGFGNTRRFPLLPTENVTVSVTEVQGNKI